MDYRINCVKNLSVQSLLLILFPIFLKKKPICTSINSIGDSDKLLQNQDP